VIKVKNNTIHLAFLWLVIIISITGFWKIYFGPGAQPTLYHHLHVVTIFAWLILLMIQLVYIDKKKYALHKKLGISIFVIAPLLIASLFLLSVHSASKAAERGEADALVVQNIFPALEVGIILLLGFVFRKNRKLHGQLLLSSTLLFLGIALFFTLLSFVPQYKIDGPETFYRFENAAIMATNICVGIGLVLFILQWRTGWPWLLVSVLFFVNAFITILITEANQMISFTALVGSINEFVAFVSTFILFLLLLALSYRISGKKVTVKG
jgi:hypothetical protein